ncbi:Ovarian cancer-associated protein 2 [Entophlyctis sp. JEL0112]|nr:Ovarian cancer-associated protein 2 [Entophlyctis sp. JEL0112]
MRILCLHGFAQNAAIFRRRSAVLRKDFEANGITLAYLDAPHIAPLYELEQDLHALHESARLQRHGEVDPAEVGRAWWVPSADRTSQSGYAESIKHLLSIWSSEGPFDGILGFSQGAALAPLFLAELRLYNSGQQESGKLLLPRFMILISGFIPVAIKSLALLSTDNPEVDGVWDFWRRESEDGTITTPTMHVIGTGDAWVSPAESRALAARFYGISSNDETFAENKSIIVEHDGGHYVPTNADMRTKFKEFVLLYKTRP